MNNFHVVIGRQFNKEFCTPLFEKVKLGKASKTEVELFEKISKIINILSINPRHNSLNSHPINTLSNRYKTTPITVFESYIENRNSRAGRLFWIYSPIERGVIVIVGFSDHPENTKFGYDSLKFPDLKQYENNIKEKQMRRKIEENTSNKEFQELFQMFREYWENDSNRNFKNEYFRPSELKRYLNKVCKFDFSDDEISDILSNWERNKLISRFASEIWRFGFSWRMEEPEMNFNRNPRRYTESKNIMKDESDVNKNTINKEELIKRLNDIVNRASYKQWEQSDSGDLCNHLDMVRKMSLDLINDIRRTTLKESENDDVNDEKRNVKIKTATLTIDIINKKYGGFLPPWYELMGIIDGIVHDTIEKNVDLYDILESRYDDVNDFILDVADYVVDLKTKEENVVKEDDKNDIIVITDKIKKSYLEYNNSGYFKNISMISKTILDNIDWYDAMKTAKNFNLGGYNDWRLPTIEETYLIMSILKDHNIDLDIFPNLYWSSTDNSNKAYAERDHSYFPAGMKLYPEDMIRLEDKESKALCFFIR